MLVELLLGLFIVASLAYWALKKEKLGPRLTPPTESYVGEGFVSVVVPAYNEGDGIKLTLATIDELAQDKSLVEIIVVDAGCRDNTMDAVASMKLDVKIRLHQPTPTQLLAGQDPWHGERGLRFQGCGQRLRPALWGRGPAMNAGARVAKGDLFLFVHADTVVPPAFDVDLRNAFQDPGVLMTTFSFGVNRALLRGKEPFGLATMERVTNYRTRSIHLPYGDQAFCFTAHKFAKMGGFPDFVMMEDFEVVRRIRKEELAGGGEIRVLDQAALCAPRRWEQPGNGCFTNFCKNWCFLFMYTRMGITPEQIFRLYYGRYPDPVPVEGVERHDADDNLDAEHAD